MRKQLDKKQITLIVMVLLLVCLVAVGLLYKRDHDRMNMRLASAESQLTSLKKENDTLTNGLKDANAKLSAKNNPSVSPTPPAQSTPALTLKITGVTKDSRGYGYTGDYTHEQILVDVSLTNNTSGTLNVVPSSFTLKDGNNVQYDEVANDGWPPDANKTELKSQTLDPGETLNGTISFQQVPVNFDTFRLYYSGNVYNITPQDATYGWYTYPWCKGIEGTGQLGC